MGDVLTKEERDPNAAVARFSGLTSSKPLLAIIDRLVSRVYTLEALAHPEVLAEREMQAMQAQPEIDRLRKRVEKLEKVREAAEALRLLDGDGSVGSHGDVGCGRYAKEYMRLMLVMVAALKECS